MKALGNAVGTCTAFGEKGSESNKVEVGDKTLAAIYVGLCIASVFVILYAVSEYKKGKK